MRRYVGFALVGMIAALLVSFLPSSASTIAIAIIVGVGAAGGSIAHEPRDIAWLAGGALVGTAAGGGIQALGAGGPDVSGVITASATVALVVAAAGYVALVVTRARQPPPPRHR